MEFLVNEWIKSNSPCLMLNTSIIGKNIKEVTVIVLAPTGEVKELNFVTDGIHINSAKTTLSLNFGGRENKTLIDILDSFVTVYPSRGEWVKKKRKLKSEEELEGFVKFKMKQMVERIYRISTETYNTAHIEVLDKRTLGVYVSKRDGSLFPEIIEISVGVNVTVLVKNRTELSPYLNEIERVLGNVKIVGVLE